MTASKPYFIILCLLLTAGCTTLREKSRTEFAYTLENTMQERIRLDIYQSEEDYHQSRNAMKELYIEAGSGSVIELTALKDYYFDWYTETYSHNNWAVTQLGFGGPATFVKYTAPKIDDRLILNDFGPYPDTSRSILLENNGHYSQWIATKAYTSSGTPLGDAPYLELKFYKNFQVEVKQKDGNGNITPAVYRYTVNRGIFFGSPSMQLFIRPDQGSSSYMAILGFNHVNASAFPPHRDTLVSSYFFQGSAYYKFARIK